MVRLAWETRPARLDITGNGGWNLININTTKPLLEMESTMPKIEIDQSECFAEVGLKSNADFAQDNSAFARQMASQAISRIVSQGNQMADFHNGEDAIAEQADYNAFGMFEKEFVYDTIPKSRPKITLNRGTLNYNLKRGEVDLKLAPSKLNATYTPYSIKYYTK